MWDFLWFLIFLIALVIVLVLARRLNSYLQTQYTLNPSAKRSRRKYQRLEVRIPIQLSSLDGSRLIEANILDISAGGIRFTAPLTGIAAVSKFKVMNDTAPWNEIGHPELFILRIAPSFKEKIAEVRGQWIELTKDQLSTINKEVVRIMKELTD